MTTRLYGPNGNILSSPPKIPLHLQYPAAVEPPPEEPPWQNRTRPWMGSSDPQGLAGFLDTEERVVKRKLEMRRVFSSTFVADPTDAILPDIEAGRIPVYSMKQPSSSIVANWTTFANNVADLPGFKILIPHHEPENDAGATPASFETIFQTMYDTVKPIVGDNTWIGPCYQGVTSYAAHRAEWWALLDTMTFDAIFADAYNQLNRRTFSQIFDRFENKAATRTDLVATTGVPWGVTEFATHGTDDERTAWLRGAQGYWEDPAHEMLKFVMWFNSTLGDNAAYVGWEFDHALPDGWYPQVIPERHPTKLYARAKPADVAVGIEWVIDEKLPAAYNSAMNTPRRQLGPVIPPDDPPPTPPDFGALDLGSTNYPISDPAFSQVLFVSPAGSDLAVGGESTPVKTLGRALAMVGTTGAMIIMREGEYPESCTAPWRRGPIVIQAYPGEIVWMTGSQVVTGWIEDSTGPGGVQRWRKSNWDTNFDRTPGSSAMIDPAHPEASWPEQVWIDETALQQAATLADCDGDTPDEAGAPGKFFYDTALNRMWIDTTPFNKVVKIAVRQVGLSGQIDAELGNPRMDVKGIGFKHYATSHNQFGALRVYGPDTLVEHCHFEGNSRDGIFYQIGDGIRIHRNTFRNSGCLGIHGFRSNWTDVAYNLIETSNRKLHETGQEAGGGKWVECVAAFLHHNKVENNHGHGLWLDLGCHFSALWRNECIDQSLWSGLMFEMSNQALICGNYLRGNGYGVLVSEAAGSSTWNNTFVNNTQHYRVQRGPRPDDIDWDPLNFEQVDYQSRNNVYVQTIDDNNVNMVVWQDSHGGTHDYTEANWTDDYNAFYFDNRGSADTAQLTIPGTTTWTSYGTLTNVQTSTTTNDNSIATYDVPTNPYLEADLRTPKTPLIETGTPVPEEVRVRLELTIEEAATPNIGAF